MNGIQEIQNGQLSQTKGQLSQTKVKKCVHDLTGCLTNTIYVTSTKIDAP